MVSRAHTPVSVKLIIDVYMLIAGTEQIYFILLITRDGTLVDVYEATTKKRPSKPIYMLRVFNDRHKITFMTCISVIISIECAQ